MSLDLRNNAFNSFHVPVVTVDQRLIYVKGRETSGSLTVSLKSNSSLQCDHESVMATDSSTLEHSEITDFAHFDNETAIAAVEEISDGEQKQEIESVIEVISNAEHETYCYEVRKGRRKRHWSHEWQNFGHESDSGSVEASLNDSTHTSNAFRRKPKKRLFAHR